MGWSLSMVLALALALFFFFFCFSFLLAEEKFMLVGLMGAHVMVLNRLWPRREGYI